MADAIPITAGAPDEAPVEVAAPAPKKVKAIAKTLEDGFEIPEGSTLIDTHEAYRTDN